MITDAEAEPGGVVGGAGGVGRGEVDELGRLDVLVEHAVVLLLLLFLVDAELDRDLHLRVPGGIGLAWLS